MRRAKALFIGCENPARFALEAEFAPIRYFIFASFAVSFAIFAVERAISRNTARKAHQVKCPFEQGGGVRRFAGSLAVALMLAAPSVQAQQKSSTAQERTAQHFDSIHHQPGLLLAFLREMPKGGDLHIHLAGAIYAESLIDFAAQDGFCIDRTTSVLIAPPCDDACDRFASKPAIRCAYQDHVLYNSIVDAWSMRNWAGEEPGHDHFFASFNKFLPAMTNHLGDSIAETAERAASDHLQYLELMHTADGNLAPELGAKVGWDDDFAKLREKLLASGLKDVVAATRQQLDHDEAKMRQILRCGSPHASAGCGVTIRYLYQVLRGLPKEQVYAQILLGFELAQADPRFVGLNLVMPEDWYVPMHDFDLHMKMLDYLHGIYPRVHISLHADELAMGLVPPEGLSFHIRESIEKGHAERIGHGVSVMNERDATGLLEEMARRKVMVEICLTSNDLILGVRGEQHPLPVYLRYGIPVALATDDQGVSRSDMTHEYVRAAESYHLSYLDLKRMARQSLEHSFLAGAGLWSDAQGSDAQAFHPLTACAGDRPEVARVSAGCQRFLDANDRARVQWELEREFAKFETKF
jgi:adenosine deaminase